MKITLLIAKTLKVVFFLCIPIGLMAQKNILSEKEIGTLKAKVEESAIFQKGFSSFVLFDPDTRDYLYSYQADKYFTPASNNKVLTFFAAETILSDTMPVLYYQDKGDTLLFWGTAYPFLLHPDFEEVDTLATWLRSRDEQVWQFSNANYKDERYGEGWCWDDYLYGYQMEKSALPIFGNMVRMNKHGHLGKIKLEPAYFQDHMVYESSPTFGRLEDRNVFTFGERALRANNLKRRGSFRWSPELLKELLQDTFKRLVQVVDEPLPKSGQYQEFKAPMPDTIHKALLQDSDNFIAEQLLLMASAERYGNINTARVLEYINDTLLAALPKPLDWIDGSGLSRYNQATPEDLIIVLDQLFQRIPTERLLDLFPTGGQSGTIKNWYQGPEGEAFIFAKTGTLRHVHCLSGYLRAKDGKVYIFSFMHNNFPDKVKELKEEMEEILLWLYEKL